MLNGKVAFGHQNENVLVYLCAHVLLTFVLQVQRPQNSTLWTLQIKYPQLRDAGIYECQINSEPKMFLSYALEVIGKLCFLIFPPAFVIVFRSVLVEDCRAKMEYLWQRKLPN